MLDDKVTKIFNMTAVFHGQKTENLLGYSLKTRVNSTLSPSGMEGILGLSEQIALEGPFDLMVSSRLARALDTASVLAIELDMDFITCKSLGQHATKDSDELLFYPNFEGEWFQKWQEDAMDSLTNSIVPFMNNDGKTLVVSHRPMLAGFIGVALGINDEKGLEALILSNEYTSKGYVNFEVTVYESGKIGLTIV